jgi:hypothetical protein
MAQLEEIAPDGDVTITQGVDNSIEEESEDYDNWRMVLWLSWFTSILPVLYTSLFLWGK